ncbi:uncharacterized protein L3040_002678 [Drepanopeziza brunnea f. sp. 'multigermtubi']|nr:hypothetical protein L3040_002678 [Drepanopeziza brunnea f. sp. 'multigermtubi']
MIAANNFIARGFKKFRHLPPELRSCVWSLASLDHAQSRVHIIFLDTQRSKYVSNQHRSALLRTCFESRAEYLRSTKTTFAFENHINFEIDTVLVWETFATYNADQNIPDDFLTTWFSNFLKFQATSQIKHLALGEDIFLALDPEVVNSLRIVMPQCREVTVLVDGTRSTLEIADLKLTHLSARQQRKLLAVVEVRHWAKACNLFGLKKGNGREDDFLKIRYAIAEPLEETSKELDEQSSCSDEGDT